MKGTEALSIGLALATLLSVSACAPEAEAPSSTATYFHGMRFVSGDGSPAVDDAAVVVDDGRIVAVGSAAEIEAPAGAAEVDLSGRTVMPTLHSLHVHVGYLKGETMAAENYGRESVLEDLNRYAYYGVGSVLVVGSDVGDTAFQIRQDQRTGDVGGAQLFTAGRGITAEGGWPTQIPAIAAAPQQVSTEEEAREAVRNLAAQDADAVKIWVDDRGGSIPKISPELYGAAIDEAKQHGIPVVAHVYYLEDAKGLVEAGVSGLVHSVRDQGVDDELVEMMKANDVFYVPTLTAHQAAIAYAENQDWVGEEAMRETVDPAIVAKLESEEFIESQKDNPALPEIREELETALANVKKLHQAGVRIAVGTDSGTTNRFPGYFEHRELELLVEAGLSPQEAITAGTSTPAAILGLDEVGVLTEGFEADFIVLGGDPLADIRNTRDIEAVYFDGEKLERDGMSIRISETSSEG